MFEEYSDRARHALESARDKARVLNHEHVMPEHIFLAVIEDGRGIASIALAEMEAPTDNMLVDVKSALPPGTGTNEVEPTLSADAQAALELSRAEAAILGHQLIGTEHLLLGLIRGRGIAAQTLAAAGVELSRTREKVVAVLSRYSHGRPMTATPHLATDPSADHLGERTPGQIAQVQLEAELSRIRAAKAVAIQSQNLELAGGLREREKEILRQLAEINRRSDG